LDEPTTGLDVAGQHRIWSLIKRLKQGKIVLLTTHSMEEAEVLGDRISIMQKGVLKTSGTTMFLKNRYGAGYRLFIEKKRVNESEIIQLVQKYFPGMLR
jgi:ABC-type multidrug transport system ATPase subunit